MPKPNRREDYLRRERTRNIIILASIVVLIFVCSTDAFKSFTSHLFGTDKDDNNNAVSASTLNAEDKAEEELQLKIFCFDVGEGTSTLIRAPINNGYRDILIDAGNKENSDKLLSRLSKFNIAYIETVVCAHRNEDNIGGMAAVIEKYTVKDFLVAAESENSELNISDELASAISSRQLRAQVVSNGDGITYQDADNSLTLEFYSAEGSSAELDYSISYKGNKFDFSGKADACVCINNSDEYLSTKTSGMISISVDNDGIISSEKSK